MGSHRSAGLQLVACALEGSATVASLTALFMEGAGRMLPIAIILLLR